MKQKASSRGSQQSRGAYRGDLEELVEASSHAAKLVVLVTLSTRLRRDQSPDEQTRAAVTALYYMPYISIESLVQTYTDYNNAIRQVASASGVLLVAAEDSIPGDGEHFADSVHFTDKGSAMMARRVIPSLLESEVMHAIVRDKSASKRIN
jgi:hypothetical protein